MDNTSLSNSLTLTRFLQYLLGSSRGSSDRLPSIAELSKLLHISQPALREQVEQAKVLGLVTAKPKLGTRRMPYSFAPAVLESIKYAIQLDPRYFTQLSEMRKGIEKAFWYEAVSTLDQDDMDQLDRQVSAAKNKLEKFPAEMPHLEHRTLHMTIYTHLENTFVTGILEGFWTAYEMIGMNQYSDIGYLRTVWNFHERIVASIARSEFDLGFNLLMEHLDLIQTRGRPVQRLAFE